MFEIREVGKRTGSKGISIYRELKLAYSFSAMLIASE